VVTVCWDGRIIEDADRKMERTRKEGKGRMIDRPLCPPDGIGGTELIMWTEERRTGICPPKRRREFGIAEDREGGGLMAKNEGGNTIQCPYIPLSSGQFPLLNSISNSRSPVCPGHLFAPAFWPGIFAPALL
jgi:hypothetical protein